MSGHLRVVRSRCLEVGEPIIIHTHKQRMFNSNILKIICVMLCEGRDSLVSQSLLQLSITKKYGTTLFFPRLALPLPLIVLFNLGPYRLRHFLFSSPYKQLNCASQGISNTREENTVIYTREWSPCSVCVKVIDCPSGRVFVGLRL